MHKTEILIVDDDPTSIRLLSRMFHKDQYETIVAYNGKEALEKTKEKGPDLIVLDINMPGMSGYEVMAALKKNSDTKQIPVIMVTTLMEADYKIKTLEAGADAFFEKPVNRKELLKKVDSLLSSTL